MSETPSLKLWPCLIILISVAMMGAALPVSGSRTAAASEVGIVGADFSSLLLLEENHQQFKEDGVAAPAEEILSAHGVNYSRIRLWVNPEPGSSDLASALDLARRSTDAGMEVLLDLHYSDTWAEPENQKIPAAWENLGERELIDTVRSYTHDVVRAFSDQGTPVAMVQVGNEVTNGMLWSWGKVDQPWGEYWDGFAALYKAGAQGARAATPDDPPRIMLHYFYEEGGHPIPFFDKAVEHGMPFDVIGLTYYPFWHGSLRDLSRDLNVLAIRYGRGIVVVETGYPWTGNDPANCPVYVDSPWDLPDRWLYPPTPEGQSSYFAGLRNVLAEVPGDLGLGYFVWEPAWLPSTEITHGSCNKYANLTLFDWYGNALPALDSLAG